MRIKALKKLAKSNPVSSTHKNLYPKLFQNVQNIPKTFKVSKMFCQKKSNRINLIRQKIKPIKKVRSLILFIRFYCHKCQPNLNRHLTLDLLTEFSDMPSYKLSIRFEYKVSVPFILFHSMYYHKQSSNPNNLQPWRENCNQHLGIWIHLSRNRQNKAINYKTSDSFLPFNFRSTGHYYKRHGKKKQEQVNQNISKKAISELNREPKQVKVLKLLLSGDIETNPGPNLLISSYIVRGCNNYKKLKRITAYYFKYFKSDRIICSLMRVRIRVRMHVCTSLSYARARRTHARSTSENKLLLT